MLRKTNPKKPSIIEAFRAIRYAEKAGSGFDKIFTALLSHGKKLPDPILPDNSITFRVDSEIYSDKLIELSHLYQIKLSDLEVAQYINRNILKSTLAELIELEFIELSGNTSGLCYILHKSKNQTTKEKIKYSRLKKQEKAKQREAILRYVDSVGSITNAEARELLKLPDTSQSSVSRLLSELWKSRYLDIETSEKNMKRVYKKKEK